MSKVERRAQVTVTLQVTFDPDHATPEAMCEAVNDLIQVGWDTVQMDQYGNVQIGYPEAGAEVRILIDSEEEEDK